MPRRRTHLTHEEREGDLAPGSRERVAGSPRPASDEGRERSATSAVLDLQHLAGNRAVAGLVTAPGPGVGVGVQRLPDAPPAVQRIAPQTLHVGSSGDAVSQLQAQLNGAGAAVPQLAIDGRFGRRTRAAVIVFQRGASLAPDGVVGARTRAALASGIAVGPGPGEAMRQVAAAIEHQVEQRGVARGAAEGAEGAAGAEAGAGAGGQGGRGSHIDVSTPVGAAQGDYDPSTGRASGSVTTARGAAEGQYDASTGSGSGSVTTAGGSASGSYDSSTGDASASGEYHGASGTGSASASYNTETGSASGSGTWNGSSASGSYDATTGSGQGSYTSSSGSTATGAWDAESGTASGSWEGSGGSSASATVDTSTGTGGGAVHTQYGNAQVSYDGDEVHAAVVVPGVGAVGVDLSPDPADWL